MKKGLENQTCYEDKKTAKYNLSLNDLEKEGEYDFSLRIMFLMPDEYDLAAII